MLNFILEAKKNGYLLLTFLVQLVFKESKVHRVYKVHKDYREYRVYNGPQGDTGNGIATIVKTSTSGLVDTYTITFTNGTTTTFEVTNGEDGEVTQAQLDEVIELNERMLNNTPKGSTNTNPTYINDSADLPLNKFSLGGKSEQGENPSPDNPQEIINVEGINKLDKLTTSPKSSGVTYSEDLLSATVNFDNSSDEYFMICPIESPTTKDYTIVFEASGVKSGESPRYSVYSNQLASSTLINGRNYVNIPKGTSINNSRLVLDDIQKTQYSNTSTVTFSKFMLLEGTYTQNNLPPYVPYNCIQIKKCNKNFNINNGINITLSTSNKMYIPKGTYSVSLDTHNNFGSGANLYMQIYDMSMNLITSDNHLTGSDISFLSQYNFYRNNSPGSTNKITFTTDDDYYLAWGFNNVRPTSGTQLQIEQGLNITNYVAHAEKAYNFPLSEGQKLMQDGTIDNKVVNTQNQAILDGVTEGKKVTQVALHSGTGLYYCACTNVFDDGKTFSGGADVEDLVCSHFQCATGVATNHCYRTAGGSTFVFVLIDQTITTVEQANTWLSNNNVKVEYPLATPDETNFTSAQQAVIDEIINDGTYKEVTHIEATANINPDMNITYYKDLETLFKNLENS